MSLWIKLFADYYRHRKLRRLLQRIGEAALWVMPRLWCYAAESQDDGCFTSYTDQEIADAIGYKGDAAVLVQAMVEAGFMDADTRTLHDWAEHNYYHAVNRERAKKAAEARWANQAHEGKSERLDRERASIAPSIPKGKEGNQKPRVFPSELMAIVKAREEKVAEIKRRGHQDATGFLILNDADRAELKAAQEQLKQARDALANTRLT